MAKGYWIAHVDVDNVEEYSKYVAANGPAFKKYGAVCLARGGRVHVLEGTGRARNVVWEFPSFQAAIDCYNSPEYQAAKALRKGHGVGEFVVVEGMEDGPTPA
jgi:uncharacterized protein (DUF1330 family)